jgi:predicted lipoprotein with Yx(FWY)xxD motif
MTKFTIPALLSAVAVLIAGCGGSGGSGGAAAAARDATVSVASVGSLGGVLVDSKGMTLYTSDQEAKGKILCTGACASFWKPLEPGTGTPTADGDAGKLAVIRRPDGKMQVTADGHPLYTFAEDGQGDTKGNGFTDDFSGRHFIWHAVAAGGTPSMSSTPSGSGGKSPGGGY